MQNIVLVYRLIHGHANYGFSTYMYIYSYTFGGLMEGQMSI